jgi:BASS family bile acid:Na+ symporter
VKALRTGLLDMPGAALVWIGRQGGRAIAALVLIGIAVPPLGARLKPFVPEAIFVLLCLAFLQVDVAALRRHLAKPVVVLAAAAWTMVAIPVAVGAAGLALGLPARSADLFLGLMLQAATSPMMAAPALAAVMGLDATLVLLALIVSSAMVPFTAPLFAQVFLGGSVSQLSPLALGRQLFVVLAGSALLAIVLRWLVGSAAIARNRERLSGLNILVLFVFVAAVMEQVGPRFLATPLAVLELLGLAAVVFAGLLGVTALLFAPTGAPRALALGLLVAQRNMGLMLAATGGGVPDATWLYFALCQFPIYLSPCLLTPLARRLVAASTRALHAAG